MTARDRALARLARVTFRGGLARCSPRWEVQDPPRTGRTGTALLHLLLPDSRDASAVLDVVVPVAIPPVEASDDRFGLATILAIRDRLFHEVAECVLVNGVAFLDPHEAPAAHRHARTGDTVGER